MIRTVQPSQPSRCLRLLPLVWHGTGRRSATIGRMTLSLQSSRLGARTLLGASRSRHVGNPFLKRAVVVLMAETVEQNIPQAPEFGIAKACLSG